MSLTDHQDLSFQGNFSRLCRNFITGVLLLFLSLLIVVPVDILLSRIPETFDAKFISANYFLRLDLFWPEQAEKAQFYFTVICLPLLIFIIGMLNKKWKFLDRLANQYRIIYLCALLFIALAFIGNRQTANFYIQYSPLINSPILFLTGAVIFIGAYVYGRRRISQPARESIAKHANRIYYFITIVLLAIVSSLLLAKKAHLITQYFFDGSFDAYFYSLVQVFKGKTILVDITTQYGLYPYFYLPLLKLFGLGITTFSIFQVILYLFFFCTFLLVLERFVSNPFLKFLCFFTLVYLIVVLPISTPYTYFYQYYPHRAIFPAAMLLYCFLYYRQASPKKMAYFGGFLLSGIALLWNLDTGIPVLGTWLLSLAFDDLLRNSSDFRKLAVRVIGHIFVSIATIISAGLLVFIFTYLRSGALPQFADMLFYQRVFYVYGYFMMPMQAFHPWNLVILAYLAGIIRSVMAIGQKDNLGENSGADVPTTLHHKRMMVFVLSILGVGLFSYFQGRSHYIVLAAVLWPATLLVAIYLNEIETALFGERISVNAKYSAAVIGMHLIYGFLILVSLIFASGVVTHVKEFATYSLAQLSPASDKYPALFQSEIDFLKANTHPNDRILILAINGGILYAEADLVNPISIPGMTELMALKDLDKIIAYANEETTQKVFVESEVMIRFPRLARSLDSSRLHEVGRDTYGNLILYSYK